jgi:hypothetical protein
MVGILALGGGMVVGCGLTPEQEARIAELGAANEDLTVELADVYAQMQAGTLDAKTAASRLSKVKGALEKNAAEIKKLQSEGVGKGGMVWAAIGMFGRSALHGAAKILPAAGPWGALIQGLLTLVLGGSETKKKPPVEEVKT